MAQGPLNDRVRRVLEKEYGAYAVKIHADSHQSSTLDILACVWGRFVGIETKTGRDTLTKRQENTMDEIVEAKGCVLLVYNIEQLHEGLAKLGFPHHPPPPETANARNGHTG